jgi:hypothetical protein
MGELWLRTFDAGERHSVLQPDIDAALLRMLFYIPSLAVCSNGPNSVATGCLSLHLVDKTNCAISD